MATDNDILFIPHGGGPRPLLGDPGHCELVALLKEAAGKLQRPEAILVISAHWEAPVATITAAANPPLIYDYYGFPEESYAIRYPCPGDPALARQVQAALEQAGIPARLDANRGFDHGLFVPLKLMYPEADIPCIQLSLSASLDPGTHLAMGRALQALERRRLLVLGSGFSFHNRDAFFGSEAPESAVMNRAFESWLRDTCADPALDEAARGQRLADWEHAPHARFCHPREEHLLPLHVCYGMASKACDEYTPVEVLGRQSSMFYWSR